MLVKGLAIAKLHELAFVQGKLGAVERVLKRLDKADQAALAESLTKRGGTAKPVKLGKKEEAKLNANNAGSKFGARQPPPSLLN